MEILVLLVLALKGGECAFSFQNDGRFSLSVPLRREDKRITNIEKQLDQINGSVQEMTTTLQKQKKKTDQSLEKTTTTLKKQREENDQTYGRMEKTIATLQKQQDKMSGLLEDISSDIETLKKEISSGISGGKKEGMDIAYQAILTHSQMTKSTGGCDRPTFNYILMNRGGGYNSGSGFFTAPVSGTYLVWAHVSNWASGNLYVAFLTQIRGSYELIARSSNEKGSGTVVSLSTIVYLKKGWKICQSICGRSNRIRGDKYSSYGGVLIKAE